MLNGTQPVKGKKEKPTLLFLMLAKIFKPFICNAIRTELSRRSLRQKEILNTLLQCENQFPSSNL